MGLLDALGIGGGGAPQNPAQGLDPRYQAIANAIDDPMVKAAFIAQATQSLPPTKELLGAAGKVPILGDVLGTGVDIIGTLSAARHGRLSQEKAARAYGGSQAFSGLPDAAQVANYLQSIRTGKSMEGVHNAQQRGVEASTQNEKRITDATIDVKNAEKAYREAATDTERMQAYERFTAAQENLAQATKNLRYPGQLPEGFTPTDKNVVTQGGRTFAVTPGGTIDLGQAQRPPGAGSAPPQGAMTPENARAYINTLPPGEAGIILPLEGRPGLVRVERRKAPDPAKKAEAIKQLRESAPSTFTLWGQERAMGGTNWTQDALQKERGQQLLNLATGRPIPIESVLREDGTLDMGKLERTMSQDQIYRDLRR